MSGNTPKELSYIIQRDVELDKIEEARKSKTISIYPIMGSGGIGKTTLLNLYREKLNNSNFPKSSILCYDFDDNRYHATYNLRLAISEDLGEDHFEKYYRLREKYLETRLDPAIPNKEKDTLHAKVHHAWIEIIEKISNKNSIVILFDTLDALSSVERKEFAKTFFLKPPKNIFFVIAGRDHAIKHFIQVINEIWLERFSQAITNGTEIKELSYEEYYLYCTNKCEEHGAPLPWKKESELDKKTFNITKGVPIIVDLFITVAISDTNNSFLSIIDEIPLNEVESKTEWFKNELIHRFSRSSKVNELVPLMEHVCPLNYKMLAELKDIDEPEAIRLMQQAKKSAFIKLLPDPYSKLFSSTKQSQPNFSIKLHDIMAELMRNYGWKYIDPEGKDRKEYSEKFLIIADNIDNKLGITLGNTKNKPERIRLIILKQNIIVKKLKHTLFLDPIKGLKFFIKLYKESYGKKHIRNFYIKELFKQIGYFQLPESTYTNFFEKIEIEKQPKLIVDYLSIEAEFWGGGRDKNRAEKIFSDLNQLEQAPQYSIQVYDDMAEIRIKAGNLTTALNIIEKGINYCQDNIAETNKSLFREMFNLLTLKGWTLRLMGKIKSANKAYNEAHQLRKNKELKLDKTISLISWAHLLNTSSYVKAILRDYDLAIKFSDEAKKIFNIKEENRSLGMLKSTRGRIEIEFDNYDPAIKHYLDALDHFSNDNDKEWKSKIYLGLAQSYLLKGRYEHSINKSKRYKYFTTAEENLNKAEKYITQPDRAELYDLKAHLALAETRYGDATSYYRTCERIASSMHTLFYSARGLYSQIRVASLTGDTSTFKSIKQRHKQFIESNPEGKEDPLSIALYRRYKGDMYMLDNDIKKAIKNYKKALPEIAKNGRYTPFNIEGQINGLTDFFISHLQTETELEKRAEWLKNIKKIANTLLINISQYPEAEITLNTWINEKPTQWNHTLDYIYKKNTSNDEIT